ncbi:hypothetical protein SM2011_c06389 [Sinorhizobium meliloti 2011]|nr:hypothetical protein SM2011_c06389 [Sinorhizobium meliloti 2011]
MASEVRLVESNIVTAGGVTAAKRPQVFRNSRLSPSLRDSSSRGLSICASSLGQLYNTAIANVMRYSFLYTRSCVWLCRLSRRRHLRPTGACCSR